MLCSFSPAATLRPRTQPPPVRSSHSFHTDRLAALVLAGCDLFKINGVADATARSFVHKYWDHTKSALTNILFLNEMIQSGDYNIGPVPTGTTTFAEAYVGFLFQPVFDIRCSPPILRYASDPDLLGVTAEGQVTAFIPPCYRTSATTQRILVPIPTPCTTTTGT